MKRVKEQEYVRVEKEREREKSTRIVPALRPGF